jgi:hypothetical protein
LRIYDEDHEKLPQTPEIKYALVRKNVMDDKKITDTMEDEDY